MAALRIPSFTKDAAIRTKFYLQKTDANMVFNNKLINLPGGKTANVRGYIGIESEQSEIVLIGASYTLAGSYISLVCELKVANGSFSFNFIEIPSAWKPNRAEKEIKALLRELIPDLDKRMIKRAMPSGSKRQSGSYNGPRLEAWARRKQAPPPKWNKAKPLFTEDFKRNATRLNVTYK